jgi:DNA invertase Pin-like site-specific DNA recombinase
MNNNGITAPTDERTWKCALYLRLSKEDSDKEGGGKADGDKAESDSITNQKALLTEYVKSRPELQICSERVDDGRSGVDFDRPSFNAMMDDIKAGLIDCVIVKDLSRFGRNWVETGKYIEQIFPHIGVRFIAVNDNVDTLFTRSSNDTITIPFKNIINDAYCRDISIKTKSQLEVKRKKGDFIGSFAVYGYVKDIANHNLLVIDEQAAYVVRDIFRWRIDGMSCQGIANRLNDMGVLSPYE